MKQDASNALSRTLLFLLCGGVLSALLVFGLYVYHFGPGNWLVLSSKNEDWGVFGDYVGGVLNPIFSFLAFIGVIFTVLLQARQLDAMKHQAGLEEMQRVLSSVAARVDSYLSAAPTDVLGVLKKEAFDVATRWELVAAIGALDDGARLEVDEAKAAWHRAIIERAFDAIQREFMPVCVELESLAWCLVKYTGEGGSRLVTDFYFTRYGTEVAWLHSFGLLKVSPMVHEFFGPSEVRKHLRKPQG